MISEIKRGIINHKSIKMKKIVIILSIVMLFASCQSNGFINETGQKVELGSQSSVDIFNEIDKAWAATDYEKLKSLIHSEGKFTTSDGEVFNSSDDFVTKFNNDFDKILADGLAQGNLNFDSFAGLWQSTLSSLIQDTLEGGNQLNSIFSGLFGGGGGG